MSQTFFPWVGSVVAGWEHVIVCFWQRVYPGTQFVSQSRLLCCLPSSPLLFSQENWENLLCGNRIHSKGRETPMGLWIISLRKGEVKDRCTSSHNKNVTYHQFLIVYTCVWTGCRQGATLLQDCSKPQALPRPTLLCKSRPKVIIHGACQTGTALSHNHTCIRACVMCVHIHECTFGAE